jgi:hypothetical protein
VPLARTLVSWKDDKTNSLDTEVKRSDDRFTQMAKNTYRVLLARGMKGCYVRFMDVNTENFFRSRMEDTGKRFVRLCRASDDALHKVLSNQSPQGENSVPEHILSVKVQSKIELTAE